MNQLTKMKTQWKAPVWRRVLSFFLAACLCLSAVTVFPMADSDDSLGLSPSGATEQPNSTPEWVVRLGDGALSLGMSWSMDISIRDENDQPTDTFGANDKVNFVMSLKLNRDDGIGVTRESLEQMLAQDIEFFVSKDAIGNVPDKNFMLINPTIVTKDNTDSNVTLFESMEYTGEQTIDGKAYYRYLLVFNKDEGAIDLHVDVPGLTYNFRGYATLSATVTQETDITIIIVKDEDEATIGKGEIVVEPEDGLRSLEKKAQYILRKNGSGIYAYTMVSDGKAVPAEAGDLVIFRIAVAANYTQNVTLDKITDYLGNGFTFLPGTASLTFASGFMVNNKLVEGSRDVASLVKTAFGFEEYDWALDNGADPAPAADQIAYSITYGADDPNALLAKGTTKYYYLAATVNGTGANYKNKATTGGLESEVGVGFGASGQVYDMALKLRQAALVDQQGVSRYTTSEYHTQYYPGGYLSVAMNPINQSSVRVQNVKVRIYIPEGYEWAKDQPAGVTNILGDNAEWEKGRTTLPLGLSTSVWSDKMQVFERTYAGPIAAGTEEWNKLYFHLKVPDTVTQTMIAANPEKFVIAAEIVSFETMDGKTVGKGQTYADEDSDPDTDPTNSWGRKFTGVADYNAFFKEYYAVTNDNYSAFKEKPNKVTEHAKDGNVWVPKMDEDTFDFGWISKPLEITRPDDAVRREILTKNRLSEAAAADAFKVMVPESVRNGELAGYRPIGDNDVISDPKTYIVYEIYINRDGFEYLSNNRDPSIPASHFVEQIPDELELLTYKVSGNDREYLAFRMDRYYGTPKFDVEGGSVISYANGSMYKSQGVFFATPYDKLNSYQGSYGTRGRDFGIDAVYSPNNGKNATLAFTFGPTALKNSYIYNYYDDVAYRLQVVMLVRPTSVQERSIVNTVKLSYPAITGYTNTQYDVQWNASAGGSAINKFVWDEKTQSYVTNQYTVVAPDKDDAERALEIPYRLELPSNTLIEKNKVSFSDVHDTRYYDSIVGDIDIAVNADTGTHSPYMDTRLTATGFESWNKENLPNQKITHIYEYTARYENVPYGTAVRNTAAKTVFAVVPLELSLTKKDADNDRELTGYEIHAYYETAPGSGLPDEENPVTDAITGAEVIFKKKSDAFLVVPDGYNPRTAGSWNVVLVEKKAPDGYPNSQQTFRLTINSAANGDLTVTDVAESTPKTYAVSTQSGDRSTAITVYNSKEALKLALSLRKVDQDGKPLPSPAGAPIVFAIQRSNGTEFEDFSTLTVGADGKTPEIELTEGKYMLREKSVPTGYQAAKYAYGYFTVREAADGQSLVMEMTPQTSSQNLVLKGDASLGFYFEATNMKEEEKEEITTENTDPTEDSSASTTENTDPTEDYSEPTTENTDPTEGSSESTTGSTDPTEGPTSPTSATRDRNPEPTTAATAPTTGATEATSATTPRVPSGERRESPRNTPESDYTPIGDLPVPLAEIPAFTEIFDDGVPLASLPQTGRKGLDAARIIAGAIGMFLAGLIALGRKENES